jgi:nucleoside-diphosphate-sugar epimerase
VTGAATGPGLAVTRHLAGAGIPVVGIDPVRGDAPGAVWRRVDVASPELAGKLSGIGTLVHLAVDTSPVAPADARRAANVRAAQAALMAAAASGVHRVVLVTSAMVYGANPDNPVPLPDDAPIRATPDRSVVGDWLEMEWLAERTARAHRQLEVTVLRPAILVGPGVDTALTRAFAAPRLLVVKGSWPHWQFCHLDDLVSAVEWVIRSGLAGGVTVGSPGWLDQLAVERVSGLRRIELPSPVAFGAAERLHRIGVTPAPATELRYLTHPWVVSSERLLAAGWTAAYDNETALAAHLAEAGEVTRRFDRKDATRAAAGATVALAGAVAIARARARAKRRQRGSR